jgi:hypothetical protein
MERARRQPHVAILGAGIMGSCLALFLARKGARVSLFDMEATPMSGASRWNEGKIHLGFLYGADPGLATARHLIPGGLAFAPLMQSLLEQSLAECTTREDDIFLIHRGSVVGVAQARDYYNAVCSLVRNAPGAAHYLADVRSASTVELRHRQLAAMADPEIIQAGFKVPERSIRTNWIADRVCGALEAQPDITLRMKTRITGVRPTKAEGDRWDVMAGDQTESFDYVVNTLWQNRIDIDWTAGIDPPAEWSKRYRLALFVRTEKRVDIPSAVLAVGPFGDVKNYNGRDFYLSWYPAGLVHECDNTIPGSDFKADDFDASQVTAETRLGLRSALHDIDHILDASKETRVAGGWVFAQGRGSLDSADSTLHRRDRFGICRRGRYYSVDTGKYSLAPWLAESLAREITGG